MLDTLPSGCLTPRRTDVGGFGRFLGFLGREVGFQSRAVCKLPHAAHATVVRIIEGWNLVVSKVGIVYGEFKKQYDEIAD